MFGFPPYRLEERNILGEPLLSEISRELLLVINPEGKIITLNKAVEYILGWPPDEMIGRFLVDFIVPQDRVKLTLHASNEKQSDVLELRATHKNESWKWLKIRYKSDTEKKLIYLAALDITEQKNFEDERDQLYDITSDILIVSHADGPFTKPNPTCQKVLGWTAEEMAARSWTSFVHPDDLERSQLLTKALYSGETVINFENRYRHKNGTYRWLNWRAKLDQQNKTIYAGATDITSRKEAEQEKDRFFEVASDILIITDMEGVFVKVNPACERVLGWTEGELLSHPRAYLLHPEDRESAITRLTTLRDYPDILHFESRLLHSDGEYRWISWRAKGDIERQLIYYAGFDITEQKKLENRLRQKTEDLVLAKELAERSNMAKTEFLANMSHEIRTPMNAVIGLAHILSLSHPLTPRQKECIQVLKMSADSLLDLINDLLDIAKIESGNVVLENIVFNVQELVRDVIHMMEPRAQEKGLELVAANECQCIADRPFIGDPGRIRQILINLCNNAIKFTEQGKVEFRVACHPTDQENREELIISVKDTGIGIAPDKLETIFDKFVQADSSISRKYGGTGLGLTITKNLAETMGGSIIAESEMGKGSIFTVRFLLQRTLHESSLSPTSTPSHAHAITMGSDKVLLVEDHGPNILVARNILEAFGYSFDVSTSGDDAIKRVKSGEPYVAVLMDVQMPGMDGFEATRHIRQYESETGSGRLPIIGLTAHALVGYRESCLSAGMDDYISKPIDAEKLEQKLSLLSQPRTKMY